MIFGKEADAITGGSQRPENQPKDFSENNLIKYHVLPLFSNRNNISIHANRPIKIKKCKDSFETKNHSQAKRMRN